MVQLFSGLKVVDCASFVAAPAAATILSDFGADIIKIEPPGTGDAHRELYRRPGQPISEANYPWILDSRNKRSLALDLKSDEGLEVLHRLVRTADVFITNLLPSACERLKIGYSSLGPLNPRLVYASFTAYGEAGPEADKTGFDITAYWARTGLMDQVKTDADAEPVRPVAGMGDHPCAVTLFAAIASALYRRERTGRGGKVTSSLVANGLWANGFLAQAAFCGARFLPRLARTQPINACSNMYKTSDGRWLMLWIINEGRQFAPLLTVLGQPALIDDRRFSRIEDRRKNADALSAIFDGIFAEHDLDYWSGRLETAGITFSVVKTMEEVVRDEQLLAAEAVIPLADGSGMTVASPFSLEGEPKRPAGKAPGIGEHSDVILRELGYSVGDVARLRAAGAVG
jgi:crotonobetainyl-CoA:carnitine CoA-transferase CaiB-like acyl-CoA transferase